MKAFKFSCPDALSEWVEQKARREMRSAASVIRQALDEAKQRDEAKEPA